MIGQPLMSSALNRLSKVAGHLLPERPETCLSVSEKACGPLATVSRVTSQNRVLLIEELLLLTCSPLDDRRDLQLD